MIDLKNMSVDELRKILGHALYTYSVGPIESPTPYEIFDEVADRLRKQEKIQLNLSRAAMRDADLFAKTRERAEQAESALLARDCECAELRKVLEMCAVGVKVRNVELGNYRRCVRCSGTNGNHDADCKIGIALSRSTGSKIIAVVRTSIAKLRANEHGTEEEANAAGLAWDKAVRALEAKDD